MAKFVANFTVLDSEFTIVSVTSTSSISILIVLLVQYLAKQEKLSRLGANILLGVCLCASLLIMAKVYIDFTSWSYSHTGWKFRYGAYLLPAILMMIFANGLIHLQRRVKPKEELANIPAGDDMLRVQEMSVPLNSDTSQL